MAAPQKVIPSPNHQNIYRKIQQLNRKSPPEPTTTYGNFQPGGTNHAHRNANRSTRANGVKSRGSATTIGRANAPKTASSSNSASQPTAGKLSSKPVTANSTEPRSTSNVTKSPPPTGAFAAAGQWKLPSSTWKSQNNAKTRNSSPRTTPPNTPPQPGTSARNAPHGPLETRMRRSYERAVENLYQLRVRRNNRKFPNEPKNSDE